MAKIKTKARALDMLGRQQIAGIPTALSELFKNAHDAYADYVEVDYIRKKNLLILRDDGLGMTKEEFEQRWLTIGTDSKLDDDDAMAKPFTDTSKLKRPIMGEKGIGRLSIAIIGDQVLVLTRAKREDGLKPLVAAFVNWTLFTLPSLDLDDIEIPMLEVDGGRMLSAEQLRGMLNEAKANVESLRGKISSKKITAILEQIDQFDFDPIHWDKLLKQIRSDEESDLHLTDNGYGTHFIISPVNEVLEDDIEQTETNRRTDQASRLEKALLGFTNTMYSDAKPPILARFRDHTLDGELIDRISENVFFTPEEFSIADHHIDGEFNEFGQFSGIIEVYGGEKIDYVLPWLDGLNKPINCGPFRLKLAYVQGNQRDSKLPPDLWKQLAAKTDRLGGLYMYRDGIRILPYGDSEFDFIGIEQRRTKSYSEYFFSYRRMFGAIELTRENNHTLLEKAGREGFIENKAYKQFKNILINFFIQLAQDIFNEKGDLSDFFIEEKNRQQRDYELLRKREKLTSEKKKKLQIQLERFFDRLDEAHWSIELEKINSWLENCFNNFESSGKDIDDLVFEVEQHINHHLGKLTDDLTISKPAGIGLNRELRNLWDRYQVEKPHLLESISEVRETTSQKLIEFEDRYGDRTGLRRRFHDSLTSQQEFYSKQLNELYSEANNALQSVQEWAKSAISESRKEIKQALSQVEYEFGSTSFSNKSSQELYEFKKSLEQKIEKASSDVLEEIKILTEQIKTIREGSEEHAIASNTLTETLESELEHLKEQQTNNLEMVQLGMALGVVHHEFNGNIRSIRNALRDLKPWADKNQKLQHIFERLRASFDHLDGYLRTFTPLTRRLTRKKVVITGSAILDFVNDIFDEQLSENKITIDHTKTFLDQSLYAYTSTIYPAFVNLIDNTIYWLGKTSGDRKVKFDSTKTGFVIEDTGPGISTRDREIIFEMGFSRKVGGQGMGLYVSRETLKQEGFDLKLDDYNPNSGARFIIEPAREE